MKTRIRKIFMILCITLLIIPAATADIFAADAPEGTTVTRESWYPTVSGTANEWQIVKGDYRDGKNGASTQVTNKSGSVVIRKNVLPTSDENIFEIALKVRTQASWADLLDATSARVQNGNSDHSSKADYFNIKPTTAGSKKVTVYFMDAPSSVSENSLPGNYKIVYKKYYYIDPSISGQMFLYFNNPLLGIGDHGGQKQKVTDMSTYYIPVGTYMENYEQLHHSAVARTVTDTMGPGVSYVNGSIANATSVPGVNGLTRASVSGNTLTWTIDSDGTIPVGEDYKLIKDTKNGKTVYYREYDLTYKVHLDTSDPDFEPGKVYDTNKEAKLDYTYDPRPEKGESDYWNEFEESQSPMTFPVPSVKGTLYNLKFKKVDSETGKPLAGARFSLTGTYGASQISGVSAKNSSCSKTAVSSAETSSKGEVVFENVPWGTYTLKETEAPKGYDITFSDVTRKLCYTTSPELLDKVGDEYWLKSSQIGNNGIVTNKPWPKARVTLSKKITNYSDILSDKDRNSVFDLLISGFDSDNMVFFDEEGDVIDKSEISKALKHNEKVTYTAGLKGGKGTLRLSEDLTGTGDLFSYEKSSLTKNAGNSDSSGSASLTAGSGTSSSVTLNKGNDITLTVENRYRLGDISLRKTDSVTGEGLDGAQFAVYSSDKEDSAEGAGTLEHQGKTYYMIKSGTSGSTGNLTISKLPASTGRSYILKEVKPPDGYSAVETLIPFSFDRNGNVSMQNTGDKDISISGGVITVKNHKLYELPSSGGPGTYIFAFLGALVMTAAALRYTRRYRQY